MVKKNLKNYATVGVFGLFLFGFLIWSLCKPDTELSQSERRPLAALPELSVNTVLDGSFMWKFEDYAADQFPLRDAFRSIRAFSTLGVFRQKDVNGLYEAQGFLSKMEYPLDEASLLHGAEKFQYLNDTYLDETNHVYFALIPDKNCFLAEESGHLGVNYEDYLSVLKSQMDFAQFVEIADCLELEDYYRTDTHWRQEKIRDVAERLVEAMGGSYDSKFSRETLDFPFYGVYAGQLALPVEGEELNFLRNDELDQCRVLDHETGKEGSIYDFEKAEGKDPYELFLSGSKSLLTITNDQAKTEKRLIVFRDSFGSSLIPLMAENYREIVLIDIRYLSSQMLGNFVDFRDADVLFLYSTLVLNNSETLK